MDYCGQCYQICNSLDNPKALHSARVQYGIAKGHQFMGEFSHLLQGGLAQDTIQELVSWKDARVNPYTAEADEEVQEEEVEEEAEEGEEEAEDQEQSDHESLKSSDGGIHPS